MIPAVGWLGTVGTKRLFASHALFITGSALCGLA
jgi:hypothetical protein